MVLQFLAEALTRDEQECYFCDFGGAGRAAEATTLGAKRIDRNYTAVVAVLLNGAADQTARADHGDGRATLRHQRPFSFIGNG